MIGPLASALAISDYRFGGGADDDLNKYQEEAGEVK